MLRLVKKPEWVEVDRFEVPDMGAKWLRQVIDSMNLKHGKDAELHFEHIWVNQERVVTPGGFKMVGGEKFLIVKKLIG